MLYRLLQILLFFLPLHGALTTFGFDGIRYWKEVLLFVVSFSWLWCEGKEILNKKSVHFSRMQMSALGVCLWLGVLIVLSDDAKTALLAARYLGIGFWVFFIVSRLQALNKIPKDQLSGYAQAFIGGTFISVLFGVWAHFLGGYDVLMAWYSHTISSWVPGQTIPLYHETAGIPRMQGASSGPVEFAHLLLLALMLLPKGFADRRWQYLIGFSLLVGIGFSLTRAVWLGVLVYYGILWIQEKKVSTKQVLGVLLAGVVCATVALFVPTIQNIVIREASTIEHVTKPLKVFQMGLENPIAGNLGSVGPAARARNLERLNDDKAPVAENVFIDYFAHLGLIGCVLILSFWSGVVSMPRSYLFRFGVVVFFVASLASIFDMTPLSISYFAFIALLKK